ncbi:hypothetical protein LTR56_009458 [Elasticomyces elasticus]|nr:hypothetical protein LTR56_009458 [Elasticomyces elasticus]KAK3645890.1 hypothetical protein LTR22_014556 [Elasticomyces elasticus]KAK4931023.1 hypothetical protein LTR49_002438 [Elasticomyces elasticus]KAK5765490.1 hypothetical protein LTS12_004241 [Elasticomyces elasticus]
MLQAGKHILQPDLYRWSNHGLSNVLLLPEKIKSFCHAHGFPSYKQGPHERKVYDLFVLSTELDWLDIRLHTLAPFVDFFVIVESRTTSTGRPKSAVLADDWERWAPFHSKIIHRVIEDRDLRVGDQASDHGDFLRHALLYSVFHELAGTWQEPHEGDVLIVSDVNEIPKPEALVVLRKCNFPDRLTLRSHSYYYSFQWLRRAEQWPHPQVTTYHGPRNTISPKDLRNGEANTHGFLYLNHLWTWWEKADLWNAAWHCSSCFATIREMQSKLESFADKSVNTTENREPKNIIECVKHGQDPFRREAEVYDKVINNGDVPAYVLQNRQAFGYLLDRDGNNAGFTDVDDNGALLPERDEV